MNRFYSFWLFLLPLAALAATDSSVSAPADDPAWAFKLTPSYYSTHGQQAATDLNLRGINGPHALWLGYYQRGSEYEQTRAGYELTLSGTYASLVPSLQVANHGFVGGSVNLELGSGIVGLFGYGRTNAKDYYNLNFDPNDAVTLGLAMRLVPDLDLSVYSVRDNRLHTGQVVTHAVAKYNFDVKRQLTVDLFQKHGRETADDPEVSGRGVALTYDYGPVFVRFAHDQKVNFSQADQNCLAIGFRF